LERSNSGSLVNFFSHAAIARSYSSEPLFVFGSMLPDFVSMVRARAPLVRELTLEAGVHFHHTTDAAFHELPTFRRLCAWSLAELAARDVPRGPSRGIAHVGVELLLDAYLSRNEASRSAYLAALAAGAEAAASSSVEFQSEDEAARFCELGSVLLARGVSSDASAALVLSRLRSTLARRPRLAIPASAEPRVLEWVEMASARVVASAEPLLAELHAELKT
jgi:hypothetical protein